MTAKKKQIKRGSYRTAGKKEFNKTNFVTYSFKMWRKNIEDSNLFEKIKERYSRVKNRDKNSI